MRSSSGGGDASPWFAVEEETFVGVGELLLESPKIRCPQCVFCVGERVVFDQQGVQQGVGAGGGDEVSATFGVMPRSRI